MGDARGFVFTYGTLKREFPNHSLIQTLSAQNDATFVGICITRHSYPLVIGPYGIPYLINLPNAAGAHRVKGELYSVSSRGVRLLDELEGLSIGHYERLPIQIEVETGGEEVMAAAYYAHRSFGERLWERREKAGLSEYNEKHGKEYVRMADRVGGGATVIEEIESLLSLT